MFDNLVDTLNESIKEINIENTLNEDIDSLLDGECKSKKKCVDPAECESPKDESLLFSYSGDVKTFNIDSKVNALKESVKLDLSNGVERFMNNVGDHSSKLFDISGEDIELKESIETACLFNEAFNTEEKDSDILMEGQVTLSDNKITSTLNEAVEYVFDKDTANLNVKKLLEKKNFKMQKKGYAPLTSVNAVLRAEIEKLKSIKDSTQAFSGIKAIKIQGVVCLQYKIGGKDYKNISVCYYNKDKASIRMFDVNASQKK